MVSASAQFPPMDLPALGSMPTEGGFNQAPNLIGLTSDKTSPQEAGATVTWTARAQDPDGDVILYKFWLSGPSTGNEWRMARDWSEDNTWRWNTSPDNAGENRVRVWIRDGNHQGTEGFDGEEIQSFIITLPQQAPMQTTVPAEIPQIMQPPETQQPGQEQLGQQQLGQQQQETTTGLGREQGAMQEAFQPVNEPPEIRSLMPSIASPQMAGTSVAWTADVFDQENDPILYRFFLNGQPVTGWQPQNQWTWETAEQNVGENQIEVRIVDGKHAQPENFDDSRAVPFTINAPNQKPVITSLVSDKQSPQEAGTAIIWTVEAADQENDQILYQFWHNGQMVRNWSPDNRWTWTTSEQDIGENQIEARIVDAKHAPADQFDDSRTASFTIAAQNQKPSIINFGPDKNSPQEAGTAVVFAAQARDPENDPMLYRFFLNGQPVTEWQPQNQWTWETDQRSVGDNQIEAAVRDGNHAGPEEFDDSRSVAFAVTAPNLKPSIITFNADKPSQQEAGAAIVWTAEATDQENDPILYRFFLNGQPVTEWQSQNQWTWETTGQNVGENQIEVRIIDGKHSGQDGFDDSKSAGFIISPQNQKPVLSGLSSDKPAPQEAGAVITWTAQAADQENDQISYQFLLNGQPVTDWQQQNQWIWTTSEKNVGDNQIEARIVDSKHAGPEGFDDSKSAGFAITAPNQAPTITGLNSDKKSPQEAGTAVTWTAEAADPENDPILYRFFLNSQPVTDWQPQNQWTWETTEQSIGENQIEVRVIDGKHSGQDGFDGSTTAAFTISAKPPLPVQEAVAQEVAPAAPEVINQTPEVTDLAPDKQSPQDIGTVITWTAQAADPDGDQILYRFFLNGSAVTDWQPQNQWAWTANEAGTSRIGVAIRDGKHAGPDGSDANRTAEFTISAPVPAKLPEVTPEVAPEVVPEVVLPSAPARSNETPVILGLAPDKPSPQEKGAVITWTAEAADPDGDPILYRFFLNGSAVTDWQPQNQWAWTANEAGTSQVEVKIRDGKHAGPEDFDNSSKAEFTITAPEVALETPSIENILKPVENATVPIVNATVPIAPPAGVETPPAAGDITVPVAPENVTPALPGNITETVAPAPAVEENQAPTLSTIEPDVPSPQMFGTVVTWSAKASDPENDTIFYRFFLNGPATDGSWQPMTGWTEGSSWTWNTASKDVGANQIRVGIRDGKHAGEDSTDAEQAAYFTITAPSRNISGMKFNDRNGNGVKDGGEEGLGRWTIQLTKPDGSMVSTITNADGSYRFENLALGAYTLSEAAQEGWTATLPAGGSYSVDLSDADVTDRSFGNRLTAYSISGKKFNDLNNDGINEGEPGLPEWTIQLSKNGNVVNTTATALDGSYSFTGLTPGVYRLSEVEKPGWTRTAPSEGSYTVELKDADVTGKDFGNHGVSSISGAKFFDTNGNGVRDSSEPGLSGWTIQLARRGEVVNATTTGQDGSYIFRNLQPGSYTVSEVARDGYVQTMPKEGTYAVELLNADETGRDFGNKGNLSITGVKFYDANGNGVQDEDEAGLPGKEVKLAEGGKEVATVTTGQDGSYIFSNLVPGTYEVDDPVLVTVTTNVKVVVNVPAVSPFSISGMKFNDLNNDGIKQSNEPGVGNWDIDLVLVTPGPAPDILLARKTTAAGGPNIGSYTFVNLLPGTYKISEVARQGWTPTTPAEATVNIPGSASNVNFGNRLVSPPASQGSILGVKFNDFNRNGNRDPGEPGLQGWMIQLKNGSTQSLITTTTTAGDGSYAFQNLTPGPYIVAEVVQSGWTQSKPPVGPGGRIYSFTLGSGEVKQAIDFGNYINNSPPVNPTLVSNLQSPQKVGTAITWTAGATDPDGDPLQFRFFVRGPTPSTAVRADTGWIGNVWTWSTIGYVPGTYEVEVWVRDGLHQGTSSFDAKKTVKFTLTSANLPPVVNVLFADRPAPQFVGTWVKWTALASDPEGDPIQYRYFLRGPSTGGFWIDQTGWSKNNQWVWRTTPLDVGYSEVLVGVRDGKHAGPAGSDDYDVAEYFIISPNQPPVITGLGSSVPSPQPVGATVQWAATAIDVNGDPIFYRYWLKGPSTGGLWRLVRDWSTDPTWVWPTSPTDVGTSQVQVQARDGFHESPLGWDDDASALFTVLRPNMPPTIKTLAPDKQSPQYAGTPIRWLAVASDPDNDPVLYRFWLKGPSTGNSWKIVQDWSPSNQWMWATTPADAGAYTVYVYARDGRHAGPGGYDSALGAPFVLLAGNRPPVATALTPDKQSPQPAGTSVKWTASASDPDKDPILYRFWLKGPSTANAWKIVQDWSPSNQWTWATTPVNIGEYSVYVYVRDGKHIGPGGYDSAVGSSYTLLDPMAPRRVMGGTASRTNPSLIFAGDGYLMGYQSWEQGRSNRGDVAMQKFDPSWNKLKSVWVASSKAYEDSPSIAFANGYYYLAYASQEKGNMDIYVRKYDANLNLIETKQLTSAPSNQTSPSLIAVNNDFYLAYQSWETGPDSGGDIFLTRFDQLWKPLLTTEVTDQKSYQDRPSLAFAGGSFYVAYVSRETGNLDIFLKKFDGNLNFLETKRMTTDSSDQDYPSLKWTNGQFMLLYASKKTGNYDISLDRFFIDWKPIDSAVIVKGPGDQTASSLAFSPLDGMYWVAYASRDTAGQNIYVKPLKLTAPAGLKPCDIVVSFSSTRANAPYTMTVKFYNNYGQLTDPMDLSLSWSPQDTARVSDRLQKVSTGTYQLNSVFGAKGDKSFRIGANIDGCISAKTVTAKVA